MPSGGKTVTLGVIVELVEDGAFILIFKISDVSPLFKLASYSQVTDDESCEHDQLVPL